MIYSDAHKFVFLPIPRTGTTSIIKVLVDEYEAVIYPPETDINNGWHEIEPLPDRCESYFSFTFVRHPLSRANSLRLFSDDHVLVPQEPKVAYREGDTEEVKLESFMNQILLGSDHWFFKNQCNWTSLFKPQVILKTEHLEEDFNSLPFVTKEHRLERLNFSRNNIDPNKNLMRLTREWAYSDYVKFGYQPVNTNDVKVHS